MLKGTVQPRSQDLIRTFTPTLNDETNMKDNGETHKVLVAFSCRTKHSQVTVSSNTRKEGGWRGKGWGWGYLALFRTEVETNARKMKMKVLKLSDVDDVLEGDWTQRVFSALVQRVLYRHTSEKQTLSTHDCYRPWW